MKKYEATPNAEVIGSAMKNWFVSDNQREFIEIVQKVLDVYGIDQLEDDKWYPHQLSLDIFKLIDAEKSISTDVLLDLGLAYVKTALFPPEINSTLAGLMALPLTYHLNIRNVPQNEGYEVIQVSPTHIQVKDLNPFPHDTVYGFVWGIAKRFRAPQDGPSIVTRTFMNPSDPNSDGAVYDVMIQRD